MNKKQNYRKVLKRSSIGRIIEARKNLGLWMCDAANHNSNRGCSNPECFKHKFHKCDCGVSPCAKRKIA